MKLIPRHTIHSIAQEPRWFELWRVVEFKDNGDLVLWNVLYDAMMAMTEIGDQGERYTVWVEIIEKVPM